jgi:phosphoribosylformylglycinamidine synthase
VVKHPARSSADLPIKELGDEAPVYDRPHLANTHHPVIDPRAVEAPGLEYRRFGEARRLADGCSRRWVWEQYDHLIGGYTAAAPGRRRGDRAGRGRAESAGADHGRHAALLRRRSGRGRQAGGSPRPGANITAVGGQPLAVTDNLNFGNPERPEAMGELVGCIRGIGEACRALDFPIVSGNVSLYNETSGRGIPADPDDRRRRSPRRRRPATRRSPSGARATRSSSSGTRRAGLGQSLYLREVCGREEGAPPPVDLSAERRNGDFVRGLIRSGLVDTVHDCSDGGLAVALAEMAMAGGIGPCCPTARSTSPCHAYLFGEDGGRYLPRRRSRRRRGPPLRGVRPRRPIAIIGMTGADALTLPGEEAISVADLKAAHEGWLPSYMAA